MTEGLAAALGARLKETPTVGIVGLGYVGLPLSVAFARSGAVVVGVDLDERRVRAVNAGRSFIEDVSDETLQELGALKVVAEGALQAGTSELRDRALERVTAQVETIIEGVEGIITDLRPAALDELGVQAAIEALLDRLRERTEIEIEADIDLAWEEGRSQARPQPELEATVYRVVQEALNNVVKHAGAARARIAITESNGSVAVTNASGPCAPSKNTSAGASRT